MRCILLLLVLLPGWALDEGPLRQAEAAWRAASEDKALLEIMADLAGAALPDAADAGLAGLRRLRAEAEAALAKERASVGADAAQSALDQARQARDEAVQAFMSGIPALQECLQRSEVLGAQARLGGDPRQLDQAALRAAASARREQARLERRLAMVRRSLAQRVELAAASFAVERAAKAMPTVKAIQVRDQELTKAREAEHQAARGAALVQLPWLGEALGRAGESEAGAKAAWEALRASVLGRDDWTATAEEAPPPATQGRKRKPAVLKAWLPPGLDRPRGLVFCHPPLIGGSLARDPEIRLAAAAEGLIVVFIELDGIFADAAAAGARLDALLAQLGKALGRDDLARLPFATIGHSTSGIFARNLAYARPERCLGVLHIKSGNLHQHLPAGVQRLSGIPFLAINGEFEEYGPEGGIRAEYGLQTQWLMVREQLLRWRAADASCLVGLAVHGSGAHTDWSRELSRLSAAFLRAACALRMPSAPDGACRPVAAEQGWLLDSAFTSAATPLAWPTFAGERARACWYPSQEVAEAVAALHHDAFILPDPSLASPVPADWPAPLAASATAAAPLRPTSP